MSKRFSVATVQSTKGRASRGGKDGTPTPAAAGSRIISDGLATASPRKSLGASQTITDLMKEEKMKEEEGQRESIMKATSENVQFDGSSIDNTGASEEVKRGSKSAAISDGGDSAAEGPERCTRYSVRPQSQVWVKVQDFIGQPKRTDFKVYTEDMRCLEEGEILIETLCWTVDNYMKIFHAERGSVMIGEQIGSVIESRNENYPQYMLVVTMSGWRTFTIINPTMSYVRKFMDIGELPASLYLGALGLPGLTAYFALLDICQPNAGEIVLVNAAAGSVGNVVGQIAKLKGCSVIAFTGSKARCHWLRELGFDLVFNYSTVRASAALRRVAPRGVDYYIDCVGSEFTEDVLGSLKSRSTICTIGYVKRYSQHTPHSQPEHPFRIVSMQDRHIRTSSVYDYEPYFEEATKQMLAWIKQGKLRYQEVIFNGFDRLPDALMALNNGEHYGKLIVKADTVHSLLTLPVEY